METTGRHLITLRRGRSVQAASSIEKISGPIADSREFGSAGIAMVAESETTVVYQRVGVAIGNLDPDQAVAVSQVDDVLAVEPERICYAIDNADYLRGFQAGVNAVTNAALGATAPPVRAVTVASALDESQATWGLQLSNILTSRFSGKGIKIAILDTGLASAHPDFAKRAGITMKSLIPGVVSAEDGHGHGTHCAGTAGGPATPQSLPRYGVASSAELFIGKVLNDRGNGADGDIIAGIEWALQEGCALVSMSLSAPVAVGAAFSTAYEQAAAAALEEGCLIIAAAGNDSRRPSVIAPVGHPANCPSILAVAAIDDQLQIAVFSNGRVAAGKAVAIAAPGVQIYSSWLPPRLCNTISGTSMAAPHVAGIAALFAESTGLRGQALQTVLLNGVRSLGLPSTDVGAGLVQAP